MGRKLYLDICDYNRKPLYPLFDSNVKVAGEASNIIVSTERNGWRELSFTLPAVCHALDGEEDNQALQFMKSDYLIRLIDDYETDWFIISEPKIIHSGFGKTLNVTAGHISQLLKVKNLGLEFSDAEGGNVGTASQLAEAILKDTGWTLGTVAPFYEKGSETVKVRSLTAPAKTGAFKLMATMCDLFEAKPVYHGDNKTVDIVPINPFSAYTVGSIPDLEYANGVIELHYGRNVKNVTRSMNSENLVTRLYVYGSYGDKTSGYCAIDECNHTEYRYALSLGLTDGTKYWFTVQDYEGKDTTFSFVAEDYVAAGDTLVFSLMDPASMLYLWNETQSKAYPVMRDDEGTQETNLLAFIENGEAACVEERNWFGFLMDFDYYRQAGMFTDEMVRLLARYQRLGTDAYVGASQAATQFLDKQTELSKIIGSPDFLKFAVSSVSNGTDDDAGYVKLTLNTDRGDRGVLYRTDYDKGEKKRFKWRSSDQWGVNDRPLESACVLYIIRNKRRVGEFDTEPIDAPTYYRTFLRRTDDEDNPTEIIIWLPYATRDIDLRTDEFYLVSTDTGGYLGSLEASDEAVKETDSWFNGTTEKPVIIYTDQNPTGQGSQISTDDVVNFGWLWHYSFTANGDTITHNPSQMYFCDKRDSENADDAWKYVYYTDEMPTEGVAPGSYWYNWKTSALYHYEQGGWVQMAQIATTSPADAYDGQAVATGSTDDEMLAAMFGTVHQLCTRRDKYWQGVSERIVYEVPDNMALIKGNYAFADGYGNYLAFSTTSTLREGDTLTYYQTAYPTTGENSLVGHITQKASDIETTIEVVKSFPEDGVRTHPDNILTGHVLQQGSINSDGSNASSTVDPGYGVRLAGMAAVYPNTRYIVDGFANAASNADYYNRVTVHFYTDNELYISSTELTRYAQQYSFNTPGNAYYIRFSVNVNYEAFCQQIGVIDQGGAQTLPITIVAADRNVIIVKDITATTYKILSDVHGEGDNIGIISMIKRFAECADAAYQVAYGNMTAAQDAVGDLEGLMIAEIGDLFREGYWQDDSYVDGDEKKLYDDALEKLHKIAYPETTYEIGFLDLYGANEGDADYAADPDTIQVEWPDVSISSAAHLVDEEIGINTWGFIDKIQKCYDKPWQTKITVNTNLTTIQQHSFADVMQNIASVTGEIKGKITKYDNTAQAAPAYGQYDALLSDLVTLQKITEMQGGRIAEMQNEITGHQSDLTQTASQISLEVSRAVNAETQLQSNFQVTAEGIASQVSSITTRLDNEVTNVYTVSVTSDQGSFLTEDASSLILRTVIRKGLDPADQLAVMQADDDIEVRVTSWQKRVETQQGYDWETIDGATGFQLTVDEDDVGAQATFKVNVYIGDSVAHTGRNYSATFDVTNLSVISQTELVLICNMPEIQTKGAGVPAIYTPNWSIQNPLTITPSLRINGQEIDNYLPEVEYVWKKIVNGTTETNLSAADGETWSSEKPISSTPNTDYGKLTVNSNVNTGTITYRCYVTYGRSQDNAGKQAMAEKTFTLIQTQFSAEACEISGDPFLPEDSEDPVVLLATVNGCVVTGWYYLDDNDDWVPYPGLTDQQRISQVLSVDPDDEVFFGLTGQKYAQIRVTTMIDDTHTGPDDTFVIYKLPKQSVSQHRAYLSNDMITFVSDTRGFVAKGTSKSVRVISWQLGDNALTRGTPVPDNPIIPSNTLPDGLNMDYEIKTADKEILLTFTTTEDTDLGQSGETSGSIAIQLAEPNTTLYLNWRKIFTGQTSTEQGVGIESMHTYYTKSPREDSPNADEYGTTTLTVNSQDVNVLAVFDGVNGDPVLNKMILGASSIWTQAAQAIDAIERYLWSYDEIVYTNSAQPVRTAQRVVGVYGNTGITGLTYGVYAPQGEAFSYTTKSLQTTAYMYSGPDDMTPICTFDWDYYYDGDWHSTTEHGSTVNWSLAWLREHCAGGATLRCTITLNGLNYVAYCNLIDRSDNLQAVIASSIGTVFYGDTTDATLRCRLYRNGIEVDSDGSGFHYTWTRIDGSGSELEQLFKEGKTIVVSANDDVVDVMTFVCMAVSLDGSYSAQGMITLERSNNIIYADEEPINPIVNMLWMDTSDAAHPRLFRWDGEHFAEVGVNMNAFNEVQATVETTSSIVEQLSDSITQKVERVTETVDELGQQLQSSVQSTITQTADKIEQRISQVEELPAIRGLTTYTKQIQNWMSFSENGLELGRDVYIDDVLDEEASKFKARLTTQELAFYENEDKVAYFGGRNMYITSARITNQLNIGSERSDSKGWFKYQMNQNGLSVQWSSQEYAKMKFTASVNYNNPSLFSYENFFMFAIYRWNIDEGRVYTGKEAYTETVYNDDAGNIYFSTILFDQAIDYYYIIKQIAGGVYGDTKDPHTRTGTINYDETQYLMHVHVRDDNGVFVIDACEFKEVTNDNRPYRDYGVNINPSDDKEMHFTNIYSSN